MSPEVLQFLLQLATAGAAAAAVYAGIRADLATLRVMADHASQSAAEAHRRIDGIGGRCK